MLHLMEKAMRINQIFPPLCISVLLISCGDSVTTGGTAGTGVGGSTTTATGNAATGSNNTTGSKNTTGPGSQSGPNTAVVTGTGVTVGTASSSTGMVDPMLCDKFCAAVGSNCFNNCHTTCESYLVAPCTSQGSDLVTCMISNFNQSTCTANCDQNPLSMCRQSVPANCMGEACGGGSEGCACTAQCAGGEERAICNNSASLSDCDCYLNGQLVSHCTQTIPGGSTNDSQCQLSSTPTIPRGCCGNSFGS